MWVEQKKPDKTKEGISIDLTPSFLLFRLLLVLGELPVLYRRLADDLLELVCEIFRGTVAGLSGHSLTAKGGNRGCWSGCLGGGSAGDQTGRRASTAFLVNAGIGRALDQGTIGSHIPIGLHPFPDAYTHLSTLSTGGLSGQGGQWWTDTSRYERIR